MQEIHDKIFTHLRENYPDLTFVLRTSERYGRLKQGYWFMGGNANPEKEYLCVSFWNIKDNKNMTPKIYLNIEVNGKCQLILVDKDNAKDGNIGERSTFFKSIASALKVKQVIDRRTNEERQIWIKEYDMKSFTEYIDDFIKGDKVLIDTFIELNEKKELFPSVEKAEFANNLKRIAEINSNLKTELKQWDKIVIQKLVLKNIGHFEDLEINFNLDEKKRVAVFFGRNGSGKSTILQTIALGLAGKKDRKTDKEEKEKEKNLEENKSVKNESLARLLRIEKVEDGLPHYATDSFVELKYNKQYQNKVIFNWVEDEDIQVIEDNERSNYQNFEGDKLLCLVKGFSQKKEVESENDLDIKSSEINSSKPNTADLRPLMYQMADESFNNFKLWIEKAANNPSFYNSIQPALAKSFEVIEKITAGKFGILSVNDRKSQYTINIQTADAPNGIPIDLLSDGYANVIGWVGDFVKRLYQTTDKDKKETFWESPAICLIDEIDTYLHPQWQRTILRVMAETFTNTHFIVTTHSPLVMTNLPQDLATIYHMAKNPKGKMIVVELTDFNPYGADITRFLELGMSVEERPQEVADKLDIYFDKIDDGDFEEAEEYDKEILSKLIDKNDSALVKGRMKIETRRILQAD